MEMELNAHGCKGEAMDVLSCKSFAERELLREKAAERATERAAERATEREQLKESN